MECHILQDCDLYPLTIGYFLPLFLGSHECLRNVTYIALPPGGGTMWSVSLSFALNLITFFLLDGMLLDS